MSALPPKVDIQSNPKFGQYGLAWRLIRLYREGRYCLAKKVGGKLCFNTATVPGDGPRGRCGWQGGTGRTGPKTTEGKKRIGDAQRLRWAQASRYGPGLVADYPVSPRTLSSL
jgi:hypothetical protein